MLCSIWRLMASVAVFNGSSRLLDQENVSETSEKSQQDVTHSNTFFSRLFLPMEFDSITETQTTFVTLRIQSNNNFQPADDDEMCHRVFFGVVWEECFSKSACCGKIKRVKLTEYWKLNQNLNSFSNSAFRVVFFSKDILKTVEVQQVEVCLQAKAMLYEYKSSFNFFFEATDRYQL